MIICCCYYFRKKNISFLSFPRILKQIASPGWMHETSAQGWCTGKTQRDGMEREAMGGGIGMGSTCKSMADSGQCMAKTTTIKKKSLFKFNILHCNLTCFSLKRKIDKIRLLKLLVVMKKIKIMKIALPKSRLELVLFTSVASYCCSH